MPNQSLIRFVSWFTVHLCNAIFFPTTFNTPCKWFIKFLEFWSLKLNTALIVPIEIKIGIEYMSVSFGFAWTCVAGRAEWAECGRWVEGRQVKSLNAALVGMALAAGCFAHGHGDAATTTFEFECWLPATHVVVLNSWLPSHDEIIIHYILFPWRTTFSWVWLASSLAPWPPS